MDADCWLYVWILKPVVIFMKTTFKSNNFQMFSTKLKKICQYREPNNDRRNNSSSPFSFISGLKYYNILISGIIIHVKEKAVECVVILLIVQQDFVFY